MGARPSFTQAAVSRAVRGAIAAAKSEGFEVGAIKVTANGEVIILPPQAQEAAASEVEAWFADEN